jgi:hypothetical protein
MIAHIPPKALLNNPYHHRYEVWYRDDMTPGSAYQVCYRADTCDFEPINLSINDHLNYFDVHVSAFGHAGCQATVLKAKLFPKYKIVQ